MIKSKTAVVAITFLIAATPTAQAETAEEKAQRLIDAAGYTVNDAASVSNYVMAMRCRELARKLNNPERFGHWEKKAVEGAAGTKDLWRRVAGLFPAIVDFVIETKNKERLTKWIEDCEL